MEPSTEFLQRSGDDADLLTDTEYAHSCCFTGHRPIRLPWISNEADRRCAALKEKISDCLHDLYARGYRHFICGMAIGCDMYFAESVLALKEVFPDITLEAAIPCDSQSDRWTVSQQERYAALIRACDTVTYVSHQYTPNCMMRRNEYMVDHSSVLVACFNGYPGGTMKTILYAQRKGIQTIILDIDK
ncbi:MAG: DUF1273 family protein [Oscillospiraceae bacterium]|nr:DUF1273 family protein [Oscillospiraceae bacterium]